MKLLLLVVISCFSSVLAVVVARDDEALAVAADANAAQRMWERAQNVLDKADGEARAKQYRASGATITTRSSSGGAATAHGFTLLMDTMIPSFNLDDVAEHIARYATADDCAHACARHAQCAAWSFDDEHDRQYCYLKGELTPGLSRYARVGWVSGVGPHARFGDLVVADDDDDDDGAARTTPGRHEHRTQVEREKADLRLEELAAEMAAAAGIGARTTQQARGRLHGRGWLLVSGGRCLDLHGMREPVLHPTLVQAARRQRHKEAPDADRWHQNARRVDGAAGEWMCATWHISRHAGKGSSKVHGSIASVAPSFQTALQLRLATVPPVHYTPLCLTRFGSAVGVEVMAMPCELPLPASQRWVAQWRVGKRNGGERTLTMRTQDALDVGGGGTREQLCLVPTSKCSSDLGVSAKLERCSRDDSSGAPAPQIWAAIEESAGRRAPATRTGISSAPINVDCLATEIKDSVDELQRKREERRKQSDTKSPLWPRTHLGNYRDMRDAFAPVPITYLEWLVGVHRTDAGLPAMDDGKRPSKEEWSRWRRVARANAMQYEVRRIQANFTKFATLPGGRPKKMISLALFVPNPVRKGGLDYGHRIAIDNLYDKIFKNAPTTLAEAKFKNPSVFEGKGFFGKYCAPLLSGVQWTSDHLSDWGTIVHIAPSLSWLSPLLLAVGNVEVHTMAAESIRTAGALWRWLPFDDARLDAVLSFDADIMDGGGPLLPPMWSAIEKWLEDPTYADHAFARQWHGMGPDNSAIMSSEQTGEPDDESSGVRGAAPQVWNSFNYATILANWVGAKPRKLTRSFRVMMEGFSLHRALLAASAHEHQSDVYLVQKLRGKRLPKETNRWQDFVRHDQDFRLWPSSQEWDHPQNHRIGAHTLGWGRLLFDYGFDEAFMKHVVFYAASIHSQLYTVADRGTQNEHLFRKLAMKTKRTKRFAGVDTMRLRCSNTAYLDMKWIADPASLLRKHAASPSSRSNAMIDIKLSRQWPLLKPRPPPLRLRKCTGIEEPEHNSKKSCSGNSWCIDATRGDYRWVRPDVSWLGWNEGCITVRRSRQRLSDSMCLHMPTKGGDVTMELCESICVPAGMHYAGLSVAGEGCVSAYDAMGEQRAKRSCTPQQWRFKYPLNADTGSQLESFLVGKENMCVSAELAEGATGKGPEHRVPRAVACAASGADWTQEWTVHANGALSLVAPAGGGDWCLEAFVPTTASPVNLTYLTHECVE